jgi:hypothetical protein
LLAQRVVEVCRLKRTRQKCELGSGSEQVHD